MDNKNFGGWLKVGRRQTGRPAVKGQTVDIHAKIDNYININ